MTLSAMVAPFGAWPNLPHAVLATGCHAELACPAPQERPARARHRLDHAAGRLAAKRALNTLTGRSPPVGRGTDGAPLWPVGVVGAISHSGGQAVALVGSAMHHAGLGVDLETIAARPDIAAMILSPEEMARFGPRPDALTVTLAFSAKEALFKALYPRVRRLFGFDAAELVALGPGHGRLRLRHPLKPWPEGASFDFHWTEAAGQALTALSAPALPEQVPSQARRVAPPST